VSFAFFYSFTISRLFLTQLHHVIVIHVTRYHRATGLTIDSKNFGYAKIDAELSLALRHRNLVSSSAIIRHSSLSLSSFLFRHLPRLLPSQQAYGYATMNKFTVITIEIGYEYNL